MSKGQNNLKGYKMKTKFFIAVIAIFSVLLVTESFAQMNKMKFRDRMHQRIEERLNLTDAQKTKLAELRDNHQKKMIDLRANLEKKEIELRSLNQSEKLNRSDLLKLTREISEIRNSMAIERANHHMDVYELLDKDQQKIFRDMKPEPRMRDGKKMRMHRGFDKD